VASGAQPAGMAAAGVAIDGLGLLPTVLALAVGSQFVGIGLFFAPALRELDVPTTGSATREPVWHEPLPGDQAQRGEPT
jgi:hypothetical protein